ncbi:MAG: hypothetical protein J2P21_16800 [Chloracidobacterium sp.]|nr:hypothetical protein [Chloracidobacterium sp.]
MQQQNSEGNALRTREIVRRSPVSMRYPAEGRFAATALRHAHSKDKAIKLTFLATIFQKRAYLQSHYPIP